MGSNLDFGHLFRWEHPMLFFWFVLLTNLRNPSGVLFSQDRIRPDRGRVGLRLRAIHDTAIVPGSFFEQPQHFRIGFGGDSNVLAKGLANIRKVLNENLSE